MDRLNGLINSPHVITTYEELLQKASTQIAVIIAYLGHTSSRHSTYISFNPYNKHTKKVFKEEIICPKACSFLSLPDRIWTQFCQQQNLQSLFFQHLLTSQLCRTSLSTQTWLAPSFPLWSQTKGAFLVFSLALECVLSRVWLFMTLYDPKDCSPPGSSVHGILQARILEWVALSFSRAPSRPRDGTLIPCVSCISGGFFTL